MPILLQVLESANHTSLISNSTSTEYRTVIIFFHAKHQQLSGSHALNTYHMQDGRNNPPDGIHLVCCETKRLESWLDSLVVTLVRYRVHPGSASLTDKVVVTDITFQLQSWQFRVCCTEEHLLSCQWFIRLLFSYYRDTEVYNQTNPLIS